ncbi:unnamed protein product [Diabrotica balteata]|uniref:Uncharacterized protein n=1 Tax=Diabrotica balteata TaxID=107213 RepID=A0A9N9SUJ3_DIABA|nr:unnamed protein product [Diabrotica balteata]
MYGPSKTGINFPHTLLGTEITVQEKNVIPEKTLEIINIQIDKEFADYAECDVLSKENIIPEEKEPVNSANTPQGNQSHLFEFNSILGLEANGMFNAVEQYFTKWGDGGNTEGKPSVIDGQGSNFYSAEENH